ncbi:oligosaccharide flippase family protein [Lysobacter sp. TLK-CK17T]|uniref:Oligosaccharide flippase family protein n=2 Tax=Marilutibacter chinensis TaxID=2912247 RepID=A0ABS9HQM8_9GAMM|nr:oligosaccharide flippase family protein [Lysobacter chinensis]
MQPNLSLGRHYLRYSGATVLIMAAGFISFPALTRMLDNTQYGILGYYDTWLMLAIAVVKLGGQHAILRLYPFGGDEGRLRHFATNLVFVPMAVSLGLWSVLALVAMGVIGFGGVQVSPVFWGALMLMPLLVFISHVEMTLRVSERSGLLNVSRVSWRWIELVLILSFVYWVQRSATAVYAGKIAAALLLAGGYAWWVFRNLSFSRKSLDLSAYRASLAYSLPLVVNEMVGMLLVSIDRIMLKHMLGDYAAVGVYTIGCALAMQVSVIMSDPLWGAFNPVANRVHGTSGAQEVRALKLRVLQPVTYVSIGVGAAIWAVGADVLEVLTGPSKSASGPVFMWLGALFALLPMLDVSGYGLLLKKRTMTVMLLTLAAAAANIGLNLLWIPVHGVMGSVYATVASYLMLALSRCAFCPRDLLQFPAGRELLLALGAAAMFIASMGLVGPLDGAAPLLRVVVGGVLWLLLYLVPVFALDRKLRETVFRLKTTGVA